MIHSYALEESVFWVWFLVAMLVIRVVLSLWHV